MIRLSHILLIALFLVVCASTISFAWNNSGAAFSTWPDTGLDKCYDDTQEITPCPIPGAPFYGQNAQYSGLARSYTMLGGGTMVRDNVTGLIWEMKNNLDGIDDYTNPHDADNTYTWCDTNPDTNGGNQGTCGANDTTDFISQLNSGSGFGGYTDWRLPTIKELATLVDRGRFNPAIDPFLAANTKPADYWSSTTRADITSSAWSVSYSDGSIVIYGSYKSSSNYVRAVRGGRPVVEHRLIDNGDGTVTDTLTCLQWQQTTMDTNGDGNPDAMNWQQALAAAEGFDLAGHSDWRLPDINELRSLVEYSRYDTAIDSLLATTTLPSYYWSSTTLSYYTYYAWRVHFYHGDDANDDKSSSNYVRTVRGEQCKGLDTYLADAVRILQILAGGTPTTPVLTVGDIDNDLHLGLAEVIEVMNILAE